MWYSGVMRMSSCEWDSTIDKTGIAAAQGERKYMEDRASIGTVSLPHDRNEPGAAIRYLYAGVFDGHGGSSAADMASKQLRKIVEREGCRRNLETSLQGAFQKLDSEYRQLHRNDDVGSTVSIALVSHDEICTVNLGDSRVVLCRGGQAIALSKDHKADDPEEQQRIQFLGGLVHPHKLFGLFPVGPGRIYSANAGGLAVSRAIGDFKYKLGRFLVSNTPDVKVVERSENDQFLVLATDGLWDVLSNQEVCGIARARPDAQSASEALVSAAFSKGSGDNVTVVVVPLSEHAFINSS